MDSTRVAEGNVHFVLHPLPNLPRKRTSEEEVVVILKVVSA